VASAVLVRFPILEPIPDDVTPAAYAGSQLSVGLEPPELAYAGLPMPGPTLEAAEMAPEDTEIAEAIAAGAEWMTELLARLVDKDTTLGNEEPGQAVMREALHELGLDPLDVPMDAEALRAHPAASPFDWEVRDKANLVATWAPERRDGGLSLILNGHIDVVSPEPRSQWDRDPFTAHVEADWLYGRGAADMKCGLAAILGAVKGLRELGLSPHAPVIVQSVVEEECTGNGALQTLLAGYRADAAIIAEPFGAAITTSQVGVLWFDVVIEGLPGHAAEAGHAINAIEASLTMIGALRVLEAELNASPPPPYDAYPHPISLNVGQIHAGDWNSTVPGECVTGYRFATYPGMSLQELRSRVEQVVADAATAHASAFPQPPQVVYRGFAAEGYELAQDHLLVDSLSAAYARHMGAPPALVATTGTTDARVFGHVGGIPSVCFGPYAEAAHGVGERVYLPSVVQTAQVMGLFIRDWCGVS
jgi:acetylornithine deacetylase